MHFHSQIAVNSDDDFATVDFSSHDIRKYVHDQSANTYATTIGEVEQTVKLSADQGQDQEKTPVLPQSSLAVLKSSSQEVEMLAEMFPDLSRKSIEDALIASQNDVEKTVDCLLAGSRSG